MSKTKRAILVITDGIGFSQKVEHNAFYKAKKPTYDRLFATVPHSLVQTYGIGVGLPEGQMGNSEVGHMTIGSGRVLYQDLVKISLALQENTMAKNEALLDTLEKSDRVHLIALLSDGGVHSHIEHLKGLALIAKEKGKKVFIHAITDGRDVALDSAKNYVDDLSSILSEHIQLSSIGGRFYTMDRDNRWDRVEKGYRAIVEATPKTELDPKKYIDESYAKEEFDEFIQPTAFADYDGMNEGDSVIMVNFRSDRARQITTALGDSSFSEFDRKLTHLHVATMTQYSKDFSYPVLFPKESVTNTLAEVVADAGLTQLHTAETEKYAHVTFFLNGGVEEPVKNETRVLVPSPKVTTYDEKPQMSAPEVTEAVLKAMDEKYDFIVVNYANGDMVGHTGNYDAAVTAVETVDEQLGKVLESADKNDYAFVLTSDHGNCEEMKDCDGNTLTNHTVGDVWCFVQAKGVTKVENGGLNNIAPTVLKLMNLERPSEMDHPLI